MQDLQEQKVQKSKTLKVKNPMFLKEPVVFSQYNVAEIHNSYRNSQKKLCSSLDGSFFSLLLINRNPLCNL